MVPIIVFFYLEIKFIGVILLSVILCIMGGYLLTNFYDATIRKGDILVVIGAIFWALHIIYVGKLIKIFNLPILIGLVQTLVVSSLSLLVAIFFEEIIIDGIYKQITQILYAGILLVGLHLYYKYMLKKI